MTPIAFASPIASAPPVVSAPVGSVAVPNRPPAPSGTVPASEEVGPSADAANASASFESIPPQCRGADLDITALDETCKSECRKMTAYDVGALDVRLGRIATIYSGVTNTVPILFENQGTHPITVVFRTGSGGDLFLQDQTMFEDKDGNRVDLVSDLGGVLSMASCSVFGIPPQGRLTRRVLIRPTRVHLRDDLRHEAVGSLPPGEYDLVYRTGLNATVPKTKERLTVPVMVCPTRKGFLPDVGPTSCP